MRLGIMQPYFLPYAGYFSLIKNVDRFILLDTVQFIRHGWIERNRILKNDTEWLYVKVPLQAKSQKTLIKDLRIDNEREWKKTIFSQLAIYKKRAPNYHSIINIIDESFKKEYQTITALNYDLLVAICIYLDISTPIEIFSEMNLEIENPGAADEWALNICVALEAKEYWNPAGGISIFNKKKFDEQNVKLTFQEIILKEYSQSGLQFVPGLSIIDILMFNDKDIVNRILDSYRIV